MKKIELHGNTAANINVNIWNVCYNCSMNERQERFLLAAFEIAGDSMYAFDMREVSKTTGFSQIEGRDIFTQLITLGRIVDAGYGMGHLTPDGREDARRLLRRRELAASQPIERIGHVKLRAEDDAPIDETKALAELKATRQQMSDAVVNRKREKDLADELAKQLQMPFVPKQRKQHWLMRSWLWIWKITDHGLLANFLILVATIAIGYFAYRFYHFSTSDYQFHPTP